MLAARFTPLMCFIVLLVHSGWQLLLILTRVTSVLCHWLSFLLCLCALDSKLVSRRQSFLAVLPFVQHNYVAVLMSLDICGSTFEVQHVLMKASFATLCLCICGDVVDQVKRLVRQYRVSDTGKRLPQVDLLFGSDTWVEHLDNGVVYCFDVRHCMFSQG